MAEERRGHAEVDDSELVLAMARGDRDALGALYERHAGRVFAVLLRILGQRAEAEELLHDVFLEAWRHASDYSAERGTVSAWLVLRARSRALDRRRSAPRARSVALESGHGAEPGDPAAGPERISDQKRLGDAFSVLSADEREIIFLGYFEGLSSSEMAERLSTPVGTVKSRTRSALEKLRRVLGEGRGS